MSQTNSVFSPRLEKIRKAVISQKKLFQKYSYILVFGVSIETETVINTLKELGLQTDYIVDNDESRQNQKIQQITVTTPEIIKKLGSNKVIVVICGDFWNAKYYQLEELGLKRNQIFSLVEKKSLLDTIINIYKGIKVYNELKNNSISNLVFLHYPANGDAFLIGLYLRDYYKKKYLTDSNTAIVVVRNSLKNVLGLFGFTNFKLITDQQSKSLRDLLTYVDSRLLKVHYMHFWGLEYQTAVKLCNHNEISFLELVCHAVYGKELLHMQHPNFKDINGQECENIIEKYDLKKDKTIILAPYANTYIKELPEEWWKNLAINLKSKGYKLLTNAGPNEEAIAGTSKIFIPFSCLGSICDYCGTIIGMRSGLFDVIAFSACKKIIIYQDIMSTHEVIRFSLDNMYKNVINLVELKLENNPKGKQKCLDEVISVFNGF